MFQVDLIQRIGYKGVKRLKVQKEMKVLSPQPGSRFCPWVHSLHQPTCPWALTPSGDLGAWCPADAAGTGSAAAGAPGRTALGHTALASAGGTARSKCVLPPPCLPVFHQRLLSVEANGKPEAGEPGKCGFQAWFWRVSRQRAEGQHVLLDTGTC